MDRSKSIYWLYANIKTFSNFYRIYTYKISKRLPEYLRTWNGAKFTTFNLNSNVGTVVEVWHDKAYGNLDKVLNVSNPTVIDIGANIGAFSILVCKKLKNPTVYAFEPEGNNFKLLSRNIVLNKFEGRINAFKKAVCKSAEDRVLNVAGDSSGNNSFDMDQPYQGTQTVSCTTLADIFTEKKIEMCHLLKMDCEGSEYEILLNADKGLFKKISMIVVELHPIKDYSSETIKPFLEHLEYDVKISKTNGAVLIAQKKI